MMEFFNNGKSKKENAARPGSGKKPVRVISISFAAVIGVGTLLLMMPFASADGKATSLIDALFTATTSTCVTGLVVADTFTKWSIPGQLIILMLIQIGGLGLVTFTTFFNVLMGKKLGLRSMQLAQESVNSISFEDATKLVKMVVAVSFLIELAGACLLSTTFVPKYGARGVFLSIFLAISAFCNAGIDILGFEGPYISVMGYQDNFVVLGTVMLLIILGGLGFVVWSDLYAYYKTKKMTLHTRVVLWMTGILIVTGMLMFLVLEWNNPETMGPMNIGEKMLNSLFQSVTLRTAGFNSVDIVSLTGFTKAFACFFMFIGAAPGSTGGGIKVTTAAVVIMTVVSVVLGRDETIIHRRKVARQTVYKALSIMMIALVLIFVSTLVIIASMNATGTPVSGLDAFFEEISAFGTVGLSSGVTAIANLPTKLVLILSMYLGRVGPVSFALALAMRPPANKNQVVPEGKILVG